VLSKRFLLEQLRTEALRKLSIRASYWDRNRALSKSLKWAPLLRAAQGVLRAARSGSEDAQGGAVGAQVYAAMAQSCLLSAEVGVTCAHFTKRKWILVTTCSVDELSGI
jgi:hypothetical protein